jgi:predicted nucleic acid-binding protein
VATGLLDRWVLENPRVVGVVDTNSLLQSIDNECHKGPAWRGYLHQTASLGTARLFAADHVYDELHEKLPRFVRSGITLDRLQKQLNEYLPLIKFVTVPKGHDLERDPAIAAVTDPDDVPTAVLATLLAPCVVFSGDKHLRDPGFAPDEWRPVAKAGYTVATGDLTVWSGSAAVVLPGTAAVAIGGAIAEKLDIPGWVVLLAVLGGGALYLWSPRRRRNLWGRVSPYAAQAKEQLTEAIEARGEGLALIGKATLPGPTDPTLEQLVARQLVVTREPLLATELYNNLPESCPARRTEVMKLLRSSSLFVPNGNRWQLGRQRPPKDAAFE